MYVHPRAANGFRTKSQGGEFISSVVVAEVKGATPVYNNLVHLAIVSTE